MLKNSRDVLNTNDTLTFIQQSAGVDLLHELPWDLSKISYTFENENNQNIISFEDFLLKFPFINIKDFDTLKKENVWENSLLEIYKTYNFLHAVGFKTSI